MVSALAGSVAQSSAPSPTKTGDRMQSLEHLRIDAIIAMIFPQFSAKS
jgi:hypothetical protein